MGQESNQISYAEELIGRRFERCEREVTKTTRGIKFHNATRRVTPAHSGNLINKQATTRLRLPGPTKINIIGDAPCSQEIGWMDRLCQTEPVGSYPDHPGRIPRSQASEGASACL